jgi:FkbM family methyltransferase
MAPDGKPLALRALDRVPGRLASRVRQSPRLSGPLRPLVNRLVGDRPIPVTVRSGEARGLHVVIDPRHEKFYWAGTHEPEVQRALVDALSPAAVFWDIGAHIGFFSFLASRVVGSDGQVVAFEPLPANRTRLEQGIALNQLENVDVQPAVVCSAAGETTLRGHPQSTRWSLYPDDREALPGIRVRAVTIDEACRASRRPDVLKVDVEGAEIDVLRGAERLLSEHRPRMLVEFHSEQLLAEARGILPDYQFRPLGGTQWLLT